ncbi:MAG: hypothetical protein JXB88_19750 [Spirochaetales bacterium]|nr:hypothetical protein [Spirochaetales bacterium]
MMKFKPISCFLFIILVLSCGNSGKSAGSTHLSENEGFANPGNARKIELKDNHIKSYIKVAKTLHETSPELLEQVQAVVPIDLSGYTDIITASGFKNLEEFTNTSLVISICMNVIIQAEYMDELQGKTKEDYISEFTEGLDDEDEFDRHFREEMEKKMEETLSELESDGLIGKNTSSEITFIKLLKEKVGENNTKMVLRYLDELKSIWILKQ